MIHRRFRLDAYATELFGHDFGKVDRAFDRLLPPAYRSRSALHFTPVSVANRAAQWIDELGIRSVVDIGSGVGKFCIAAAIAGNASYVGFEQRGALVKSARALAESLELQQRVRFLVGVLGETDLPDAEAYYMYNPFGENLFGTESQIDQTVERGELRYQRDVREAEHMLQELPCGTFLITYNGFGGKVPDTFQMIRADRRFPNDLLMWQKTTSNDPGWDPSEGDCAA